MENVWEKFSIKLFKNMQLYDENLTSITVVELQTTYLFAVDYFIILSVSVEQNLK